MARNRKMCWRSTPLRAIGFVFLLTLVPFSLPAQTDSTTVDRQKLNTLITVSAVGYTAGMVTLNHVWYQNTERQSFRFFNDNGEWKQMDKAGHFFSSFYLSVVPAHALRNCNVRAKKADVIGALSGFLLTIPVEIFDGYSSGYGASPGDVLANASGPAFFLGQRFLWDEIRIRPKFSFHRTGYAPRRPQLLGNDLLSEMVKDYNGQTYWLSVDVDKFTNFPAWLNVAFGYGAHDMIYSRDQENTDNGSDPYRQYYLGIDLDLTSVKTRSKWVKTLLSVFSTVRLPAPAIEISRRGSKFHAFYF